MNLARKVGAKVQARLFNDKYYPVEIIAVETWWYEVKFNGCINNKRSCTTTHKYIVLERMIKEKE